MKKKKILNTLCCLLLCFSCRLSFSQSKVYTEIQPNVTNFPKKDFYFIKVVDARKEKENIGLIYSSDLRAEHPAKFKKGLPDEFHDFLSATFPNQNASKNIIMVVNIFEIRHRQSEISKDQGTAQGNFDFYLVLADSCYLISHFEKRLDDEADDIERTHPNRIKRLLLLAVSEMELSLGQTRTDGNKIMVDSLFTKGVRSRMNFKQKEPNELPNYYFFQMGGYLSYSPDMAMFGLNSSLVLQIKSKPKYLVGANLNYFLVGGKNDASTTKTYEVKNIDVGIKVLKQVHDRFFLNFNPQVLFGKTEAISTVATIPGTTTVPGKIEEFRGFEFDIGAYLIPPTRIGIYGGVNLFFRGTDSSVIEEGGGIKLDFGIKF